MFIHIYSWKSFVKWKHTRQPVCKIWTWSSLAGWHGRGTSAAGPKGKYWNTQHDGKEAAKGIKSVTLLKCDFFLLIFALLFLPTLLFWGFSCFLTLLCIKAHLVRAATLLSNQSHPWLLKMFSSLMSKSIHMMLMKDFCFKILLKMYMRKNCLLWLF